MDGFTSREEAHTEGKAAFRGNCAGGEAVGISSGQLVLPWAIGLETIVGIRHLNLNRPFGGLHSGVDSHRTTLVALY